MAMKVPFVLMWRCLCWLTIAIVFAAVASASAPSQAQSPAATEAQAAKVKQLFDLLEDRSVRDWLAQHGAVTTPKPAPAKEGESLEALLSDRLVALEAHFDTHLAALPHVPAELSAMGSRLRQLLGNWSFGHFLVAILLLAAAGIAAAAAFRRLARSIMRRNEATGLADDVATRLKKVALNLALNLGEVGAAALGAGAVFMLLGWPGSLRLLVLPFAATALGLHLALVILNAAFARGLPPQTAGTVRALPLSEEAARWWRRRLLAFCAIFLFGWATASVFETLGASLELRHFLVYVLGIVLVAVTLDMVWRARDTGSASRRGRPAFGRLAMSGNVLLIWSSWVSGAKGLLGLLLVGTLLCLAIAVQKNVATHLLRPTGYDNRAGTFSPVLGVAIERIVRSVLVILAMAVLLDIWGIGFLGVVGGERGPFSRLAQAFVHAVAILLIVDLSWRVISAAIENALAPDRGAEAGAAEDRQRQARLRTLLPILRNVIGIALLVLGVLMALSAFGVEIGPLIAGAGVVGVAVGFGAQTLVRDVFSGMFYLLDDAFRVGEYIQSGSYRGTVESFSLRSVKLRHHRGPLFTVPFGELGAVQNMSRDWVIDKMVISVAYGSDFDKAKKIVKQIGRELAEDPDLGPDILEPLKMQGVEGFGDFGVDIRIKMVTKPGKQFVLRRRANSMIKKRFDEAGIAFAVPTVQVAGDGSATAAAAHATLARKDAATPAPA